MDVARHLAWEVSEGVTSHERQRLRAIEELVWKKKLLSVMLARVANVCDKYPEF